MSIPSGKAIIFSAPSGSGKTSLVKHLMQHVPHLGFSISACTRDRRGRHEVHGRDYYFLSIDEFKQKIDQDAFVEWEEVYAGNFYGTLKEEVHRIWKEGKAVIFDVEAISPGKDAYLFKSKDQQHLYEKMLALMNEYAHACELGKIMRSRAIENYDIQHVADNYQKTLETVVYGTKS